MLLLLLGVSVQARRQLTLAEAVALARRQSVDAAVALNELRAAYWEYRTRFPPRCLRLTRATTAISRATALIRL